MTMTGGFWLGFDLGGTGTRLAVVDANGEHHGVAIPTREFGERPVERLLEAVEELRPAEGELLGVGIGSSGPIDLATGEIHNDDTLPQFTRKDVVGGIAAALNVPTWIDNDSIAAALAEHAWGLPQRFPSLLCVTLGTGVGVTMLVDGRPVRATDGQHPEAGHIGVPGSGSPCYCGVKHCWEQVASRTALDRLRATWSGTEGDLWAEYASRVASGLITLITIHHPGTIVISGSVAQHWDQLKGPLQHELACRPEFDAANALFASELGPYGGAAGATLLAKRGIGFCSSHRAIVQ